MNNPPATSENFMFIIMVLFFVLMIFIGVAFAKRSSSINTNHGTMLQQTTFPPSFVGN